MLNNDLRYNGLVTSLGIRLSSGCNIFAELFYELSQSSFCFDLQLSTSTENIEIIRIRKANYLHYVSLYMADSLKWVALAYKTQAIRHVFFGASAVVPRSIMCSAFALPLATKGIVWLSQKTGILKNTAHSIDQKHSNYAHIADLITSYALLPYSTYALKASPIILLPIASLMIDTHMFGSRLKTSP